jgi:hypothetical protein
VVWDDQKDAIVPNKQVERRPITVAKIEEIGGYSAWLHKRKEVLLRTGKIDVKMALPFE